EGLAQFAELVGAVGDELEDLAQPLGCWSLGQRRESRRVDAGHGFLLGREIGQRHCTLLPDEMDNAVTRSGYVDAVAPDTLAGIAEIADLFGVTKQTALKYTRRPDFPAPLDRLAAGPVWRLADVEEWA